LTPTRCAHAPARSIADTTRGAVGIALFSRLGERAHSERRESPWLDAPALSSIFRNAVLAVRRPLTRSCFAIAADLAHRSCGPRVDNCAFCTGATWQGINCAVRARRCEWAAAATKTRVDCGLDPPPATCHPHDADRRPMFWVLVRLRVHEAQVCRPRDTAGLDGSPPARYVPTLDACTMCGLLAGGVVGRGVVPWVRNV
jgi:hypothetical protein